MWPYTETEAKWLRAETTGYRIQRSPEFSPELIHYYIRHARTLQSEAAFDMVGQVRGALRRLWRRGRSRVLIGAPRSASTS